MIETAINDLARRGEVDGRALRLPGIVARPPQPNGLRSAFMSELMHAVAVGQPYTCPVSATATAWWMSADCCVRNLQHAAALTPESAKSVWQLPVLHRSAADILDALCDRFGEGRRSLIRFEPESDLERLFGRYPALATPEALTAGFVHDGNEHELVKRAVRQS
jgi:nucleoside-diphosphate-sugar epimerase